MIFLDLLKLVFIVIQVFCIFISFLACLTILFNSYVFRCVLFYAKTGVIWICILANVMEPISCFCLYFVMLLIYLAYIVFACLIGYIIINAFIIEVSKGLFSMYSLYLEKIKYEMMLI